MNISNVQTHEQSLGMTGPPILSCAGVKVLVDLLKATSDDSIIQKVPKRLSLSNKFYLQKYLWCFLLQICATLSHLACGIDAKTLIAREGAIPLLLSVCASKVFAHSL